MYAYCLNNPVNCSDSTGFFTSIHEYRYTGVWAEDYFNSAGLSSVAKDYAEKIVDANLSIDELYPAVAKFYNRYAQSWHFDNSRKGEDDPRIVHYYNSLVEVKGYLELAGNGIDREKNIDLALHSLGRGIHAVQDWVAHNNWDGVPTKGDINVGLFNFHWWGKNSADLFVKGDLKYTAAYVYTIQALTIFTSYYKFYGLDR